MKCWDTLLQIVSFCSFIQTAIACIRVNNIFEEPHNVIALILARGGSKSIPLKNLARVGGHTLLEIALGEIRKVPFNSIWVSTDHTSIYHEVERLNLRDYFGRKINVHWRSAESATDEASSMSAVKDFLHGKHAINAIALVQCTSPLLKHIYLQDALTFLLQQELDCVFSVTRSFKLRWSIAIDGSLYPLNFDPERRPRRQGWRGELIENGMFYIARRYLLERGLFQSNKYCTI